ncbi:MAG: Hpt domain-containing protein [Bermanella sp.]
MAPLNMPQISELKDLMEDAFADLIDTYLSDSEDKITRLRAAIDSGDAPLCVELAHALKGASANICAEALAGLFKALEDQARSGNLSPMSGAFSELSDEFQRVKEALLGLL